MKKRKNVLIRVIGEILDEAWLGFTMKREKTFIRKSNLTNEAFEEKPIIYHARPIPTNSNLNKTIGKEQQKKVLAK